MKITKKDAGISGYMADEERETNTFEPTNIKVRLYMGPVEGASTVVEVTVQPFESVKEVVEDLYSGQGYTYWEVVYYGLSVPQRIS